MTVHQIMQILQESGNAAMLKVHQKNGAGERTYGVKMGDLRQLAKRIKKNHPLAIELWQTGHIDARMLAVLIADPTKITRQEMEDMIAGESFEWLADWIQSYWLKEHPDREYFRSEWIDSNKPMLARAGWALTAGTIARREHVLLITQILDRIENEMREAAPVVQWTMNSTLAQIGIHYPEFRKRAIDIGEKIALYKNYPVSKGCTSPYAPIWIREMVSRQEAKVDAIGGE
jgi:3-methyladenine DNA glycosylase AlkD